ncbi:hypothetical protein JL100_003410 [Skermanella mucosa]|uniref:hypothetical protein n=1 Tax=Skermanella mucosa TaxID=1789672 RepID=UPI00192BCCFB|nr:hypothetical protein [Skermanella mucosa]UEM21830.1 hypothetical protein JL100_003410 [Skermanella mucosa]
MVGTLEVLAPTLLAGLKRSDRPDPAPVQPRVAAKSEAPPRRDAAPNAAPRTPSNSNSGAPDDAPNAGSVKVEFSATAMRLSQVVSENSRLARTPLSVGRAREPERPLDAVLEKVREDLIKVLRMFGRSEEESLKAAEAVAGKAREATARGPLAARSPEPGQASANISLVFQSVSLKITSETGNIEASIEMVRLDASMTTGAALAVGLPGGGAGAGAGGGGAGGGGQQVDPLVLDMDGNGIDLTTAQSGILFDIDGDGSRDRTAWVAGKDAFLALDRDGNGRIDDGRELFGEQNGATGGFAELARFDQDGNSVIDRRDAVFNSLILLRGDGAMTRLRDEGITEIRLDLAIPVDQRLAGGNAVAQSEFGRADGRRGMLADVLLDVTV